MIGRWLQRSGKRNAVQIAPKVGFIEGLAPDVVEKACNGSLQRLGIDCIDLYYQHKDDETVPLAESLGAFEELRKNGKIREIGLSQFTALRLDEAVEVVEKNGFTKPCALQTWYNMVEREKLEGPLGDAAQNHGMGILPFYGLANGFLTGKYRSKDDLGKSVRGLRNVEYLEGRGMRVLAALDEVSAETGAALATVALAWTMAQPGITAAIASATSVDQLRESVAALTLELTADQIERLNEASAEAEAVTS